MSDMAAVIEPKSDQLNADDLISGPRTITITAAKVVTGAEQPVTLRFEGDGGKPFKPCKTVSKLLAYAWGPSSAEFVGKSLTLYRDPKVKWGGLEVGGIRVSHMSHIDRDFMIALTETRGVKKPISIKKLVPDDLATFAQGLAERIRASGGGEALEALINAKGIPARRTWLRNNRPELADLIDEAVAGAENPFEGPADTNRGEIVTLASALDEIAAAKSEADINALVKAHLTHLGEVDASELRVHALDAIERIASAKGE